MNYHFLHKCTRGILLASVQIALLQITYSDLKHLIGIIPARPIGRIKQSIRCNSKRLILDIIKLNSLATIYAPYLKHAHHNDAIILQYLMSVQSMTVMTHSHAESIAPARADTTTEPGCTDVLDSLADNAVSLDRIIVHNKSLHKHTDNRQTIAVKMNKINSKYLQICIDVTDDMIHEIVSVLFNNRYTFGEICLRVQQMGFVVQRCGVE
eukprot:498947_1